jgi:hypothetical protein
LSIPSGRNCTNAGHQDRTINLTIQDAPAVARSRVVRDRFTQHKLFLVATITALLTILFLILNPPPRTHPRIVVPYLSAFLHSKKFICNIDSKCTVIVTINRSLTYRGGDGNKGHVSLSPRLWKSRSIKEIS